MTTPEHLRAIFRSGQHYPYVAAALKAAGVCSYRFCVASNETVVYTQSEETIRLADNLRVRHIAPRSDTPLFVEVLRRHQAGATEFTTFCTGAARAGVNLWVADLQAMTVSYFAVGGSLMHQEGIPAVEKPD